MDSDTDNKGIRHKVQMHLQSKHELFNGYVCTCVHLVEEYYYPIEALSGSRGLYCDVHNTRDMYMDGLTGHKW